MYTPTMHPTPGSRFARYVGDRLRIELEHPRPGEKGWRGLLRTNLTRGARMREETLALAGLRSADAATFAGASWRDIPMIETEHGWVLELPLCEVGCFRFKACAVDPQKHQHWPGGEDVSLSVHPDALRTGNTIYCAFPRLFGATKALASARDAAAEARFQELDAQDYTIIPPSGKLRDLTAAVPHIVEDLGCRILHLLPIGPTPTTYARMGRFGSPYAQLDLTAIDPALVTFDRRATAEDQFRELSSAMHQRGGQVFLDIVVNHTGWGSRLMEQHPEWFKRRDDGLFHSPGAWGVTWADLVELDQRFPELWETTAQALLTWCRRGVDGFRCDAGYMVPLPAWQYLVARVRQEFPDTVFLLEGLGGAWEATEALLAEGGMQWAYSELFQNVSPQQVSGYLDHALGQADRLGPLVHYSETHDNDRLAKKGLPWSRLRNGLSALSSLCGGFAFTSGVEWLATEKIDVHGCGGLNWGAKPNLVADLARFNALLKDHPCFFDGAQVKRVSAPEAPVLMLERRSAEGSDACLVLVHLDAEAPQSTVIPSECWRTLGEPCFDLLGQPLPALERGATILAHLEPAAVHCLSVHATPQGLHGEAYRARRAQAAWALAQLTQALPAEALGPCPWQDLATWAAEDPLAFLASLERLNPAETQQDLMGSLKRAAEHPGYGSVVRWSLADLNRVVPVPPRHWLLVEDAAPFEITLERPGRRLLHRRSILSDRGHVVALIPHELACEGLHSEDATLRLERFSEGGQPKLGFLRLLPAVAIFEAATLNGLALLTNGRGGMARLHADLGKEESKYDCLLGANLHPDAPSDRHVLSKRMRAWLNADGFITALDGRNLVGFEPGPEARWRFRVNAGDGRTVDVHLTAQMPEGENAVRFLFEPEFPTPCPLTLAVRLDLEDRSFHQETQASEGAHQHFMEHTRCLDDRPGFVFEPAPDRRLRAWTTQGHFHLDPEWSLNLSHSVEGGRGMKDRGDAWSPGWFEVPLRRPVELLVTAEDHDPVPRPKTNNDEALLSSFEARLQVAASQFLARRGSGSTVIAGYPWFLDWGRDTLIACRGLLAGGFQREVAEILATFARLEVRGTLPNMLSAESTANRDTSDAPLWFGLACEEAVERLGSDFLHIDVGGRQLLDVLLSIAANYRNGTPNGIRVDEASGLVWSPSHFTWMDTNYPAGTPREGYPIEIQALWIRLLRHLAKRTESVLWREAATRAEVSLERFWNEAEGWCHDTLRAAPETAASQATADGHLRPNQLFAVAFGLLSPERSRAVVAACAKHLLVPGALRSLAPLAVKEALPIHSASGHLLNDPARPYWGRYEGDEDTRRKPAYHNGTAWNWLLPVFCEALAVAHDFSPNAVAAAKAYLGSCERLLHEGCVGQLPEILDGDAPHTPRGCDAQAWSVTEALRVWRLLNRS
ncbi:MAG: glycogen debranching enzyme N-terminal domain-containing protein [Firmicutes bacterium]|nr:glycogen debranching enzyme N-terminal domain-containing protein [Bacillota bacterium]